MYATTFPVGYIFQFTNGVFEKECTTDFLPTGRKPKALLCATSSSNKLVLGGDGYYLVLETGKKTKAYQFPQNSNNNYAVWDIAFIKDKIFLALGETLSNQKGFLYEHGQMQFQQNKLTEKGFLTSFAYDSMRNCLYCASLTKGLYLRKGISGNEYIDIPIASSFTANKKHIIAYNDRSVFNFSGVNYSEFKIFNGTKKQSKSLISMVKLSGDTMVVTSEFFTRFYNLKTHKLIYQLPIGAEEVGIVKNDFYFFQLYGSIYRFNFPTYHLTRINKGESFLPYPQNCLGKIVYLNREKGFHIIEKDTAFPLISDDKGIAFISDYALINNTLYALIRNSIKSYEIDWNSHRLILKKVSNLDNIVEGFTTKWVITRSDKLYLVNEKGMLLFDSDNDKIKNYYYFGNYNDINKPVLYGDSLIIANYSSLTKIAFKEIDKERIFSNDFMLHVPESVNENLAFNIKLENPDYLIQNHSLKKLEWYRNGEFVAQKYTVGDEINFPAGLKYGKYDFHLLAGNGEVVRSIDITLPLNRNPKFFAAIIIVVLAIFGLLIKNWFDKKEFTKKLSQSRLQVLKQNLNPHFVFNSMNLISSLILEGKNDEAIKVVSDFSNLQRTYLETNNKEEISLSEELRFLESYLKLQQRRFCHDNEFQFLISVDKTVDMNSILLPPLILQPLAENAIKYGVIGSKAKKKKIWIDITGKDPLIISIEDNGQEVISKNSGFGLGHEIIEERIRLFKSPLSFKKNKAPLHSDSGYRVEIQVAKS